MKILLASTGGTIACELNDGVLIPSRNLGDIMSECVKNNPNVEFDYLEICSVLSENINGDTINLIIKNLKIALQSKRYDGIILTHGSDTVAFTAAAIAYSVPLSSPPLVLVSSQLPLSDANTDGYDNLRAAFTLICDSSFHGVFVVGRKTPNIIEIHRATRVIVSPPYNSEILSVCGQIYGKFIKTHNNSFYFDKNKNYSEKDDGTPPFNVQLTSNCPIMFLQPLPGIIYPKIPRQTKAIVLGTYHSGTIDTSSKGLAEFLKRANASQIPVFVSGIGKTEYQSMTLYEKLGLIRLETYTSPIAMIMKLWFVFSQGEDFGSIIKLQRSLGGDL